MKYVITGGAGFIGSHLAETLVKQGHEVVIIDNLFAGKKENMKPFINKITFIKDDIRNLEMLKKASKNADFILHQAAMRSVPMSLKDPILYNDVNINGTYNVLEAARVNDVKRVISASSSSVYGDVTEFPEKETFKPDPISPYAVTKLAGEFYCNLFYKWHNLEAVSLRYFNVFGPRQDLTTGYATVIPKFIIALINDKQPVIYGDGKQTRDFTYISNIVQANLKACTAKNAAGQVFNIANGHSIKVNDIVVKLNKMLNKNIKAKYTAPRAGDVMHTLADPTKAKKILGYKEDIDFDTGLKLTFDWFKENA